MENRMEKTFSGLREENKKGLIGYITAGDPNLDFLKSLLKAMEDGGADVIEIGVPFSDPLADGPVIQKAAQRALKNGFSVDKLFDTLKDIRKEVSTPLVFLVYYNTIFAYGEEKFIEKCAACGIDGLIIPDLPLEEQEVLKADLKKVYRKDKKKYYSTSLFRIWDRRCRKGKRVFSFCGWNNYRISFS